MWPTSRANSSLTLNNNKLIKTEIQQKTNWKSRKRLTSKKEKRLFGGGQKETTERRPNFPFYSPKFPVKWLGVYGPRHQENVDFPNLKAHLSTQSFAMLFSK